MSRIFFDRELDTAATYWRIHRRDGVALGFTTHDRDLWFDGLLHRAAPGMLPSAIRRTIDLDDDGAEIEGTLTHDSIRIEDIRAGRFDGARVETGVVDWSTLEMAPLFNGSIDTLSGEGLGYSAQLRSAKSALDVDPVPRTSPTCRARFCGPGCTLDPQVFTRRATVTSIDPEQNSLTTDFADWSVLSYGELRWLDGPQTGISMAIVAAGADGLVLDTPFDPTHAVGARVLLREGCDRTIATCANRFGNAVNFQGEPFLPGNDLLAQYPISR